MKRINNITSIILFIVISFCSCGKSQKEINRERNMRMADSVMRSAYSYSQFVVIDKYQYHDSIIRQEITYANGKYILRTIAISNINLFGIKETAAIDFLVSTVHNTNIVYDKTISGSFNYIKNRKKNQFETAEKYLTSAYSTRKNIRDSINLLNNISVKN